MNAGPNEPSIEDWAGEEELVMVGDVKPEVYEKEDDKTKSDMFEDSVDQTIR